MIFMSNNNIEGGKVEKKQLNKATQKKFKKQKFFGLS